MEAFIVLLILLVLVLVVILLVQLLSGSRLRAELEALKYRCQSMGETLRPLATLAQRVERLEASAGTAEGASGTPTEADSNVAPVVDAAEAEEQVVPPESSESNVNQDDALSHPTSALAAWKRLKTDADPLVVHPVDHDIDQSLASESTRENINESDASDLSVDLPVDFSVKRSVAKKAEPARKRISFEELLCGKVFVWIGAVALVLTGVFLLNYGIQKGMITVNVRLISATVFGFILVGSGEWFRRRSNGIAQALCGAGVATLFGTILASTLLYDKVSEPVGFTLVAFVTVGAVFLSLRHGQLVALLGMVGGFMMPVMLGDPMGGQPTMVVYLIALELGVLAVTRKRGWIGISGLTLLFSVIWSLGYTLIGSGTFAEGWTGTLIMATAVIFVLNTAWAHGQAEGDASLARRAFWLSISAVSAAAVLLALMIARSSFEIFDFAMLGLLALGVMVLARLDKRYAPLVWVVSGLSALMLLAWGVQLQLWATDPPAWVLGTIATYGLLFVFGGYALSFGGPSRKVFGLLSALAGPVMFGLCVFAVHEGFGWRGGAWSLWAIIVSLMYGLGCFGLIRLRSTRSEQNRCVDDWILSALALSASLMIAIAIGQGFNHPWVIVGWSVLAAAVAWTGVRLGLKILVPVAAALGGVCAIGLVVPGPFTMTISGPAVVNVLWPMYLIPVLSFGVVACSASQIKMQRLSMVMQGVAVAVIGAMSLAMVRDGFHGEDFLEEAIGLYEWPTFAVVLLSLGLMIAKASDVFNLRAVREAAAGLGMIGVSLCVAGPVFAGNPLFVEGVTGGKGLALGMVYLYVLPALLAWRWARRFDRLSDAAEGPAELMRVVSVLLAFVFVGLQVRNLFSAADLSLVHIGLYERATYPVGWLALGLVLLAWAQRGGSRLTGQAGAVVVCIGMLWSFIAVVTVGNPLMDDAVDGGRSLAFGMGYIYLLPAVMMWLAAPFVVRYEGRRGEVFFRIGAIVLAATFAVMQVRNGFNWTSLHARHIGMFEWATYALAWMAMGGVMRVIAKRLIPQEKRIAKQGGDSAWSTCFFASAGGVIVFMGIAVGLLGNVIIANPLWTNESVGTLRIFNGLGYLYLPTALGLALAGFAYHRQHRTLPARCLGLSAVALVFFFLSMLVRQAFHTDEGILMLAGQRASNAEWYAYSLVWVIYGVVLLISGVFTQLGALRFGSIAVMLLAVAKVFALDTAQLEDLYRVFSFLGLGITLIALGYIYQRFVFRRPEPLLEEDSV